MNKFNIRFSEKENGWVHYGDASIIAENMTDAIQMLLSEEGHRKDFFIHSIAHVGFEPEILSVEMEPPF